MFNGISRFGQWGKVSCQPPVETFWQIRNAKMVIDPERPGINNRVSARRRSQTFKACKHGLSNLVFAVSVIQFQV